MLVPIGSQDGRSDVSTVCLCDADCVGGTNCQIEHLEGTLDTLQYHYEIAQEDADNLMERIDEILCEIDELHSGDDE